MLQQNDDNDAIVVECCNGEIETTASPIAMIQLSNGQTTVINVNGTDAQEHITPDVFANDTMAESISITKREPATIGDIDAFCYSPSWNMHIESDERQQQQQQRPQLQRRHNRSSRFQQEMDSKHGDVIECDAIMSSPSALLPTSLKFNRNTMSISVKRTAIKMADRLKRRRLQQPPPPPSSFGRRNVTINENIICSPQFEHLQDVDPNDSDAANGNYGNSYHDDDDDDIDNGECGAADDIDGSSELKMARDQRQSSRLMELIRTKDQLRSAVVLRSPRGNQPRQYTTDALYSALMDVKAGESIYR